MPNRAIQMAIIDCVNNIMVFNQDKLVELQQHFIPPEGASNSEVEAASNMNNCLLWHEILIKQSAYVKKAVEASKERLDHAARSLGLDPEGVPGTTIELYSDKDVKFCKKQNATGTTMSMTEFQNQLSRLGVSQETIKDAIHNATKEKRGNIYYEITATGE